ncbi:Thioredoxin domain-containing protein 3-like protein [Diplonema papillatum]|nr:Thioredoxin domain-containing protein 3-like protein [Diplonema papillatum]
MKGNPALESKILAPLHTIEEESDTETDSGARKKCEEALVVIKPDAVASHADILSAIDRAGLSVECSSMIMTRPMAEHVAAASANPDGGADESWVRENTSHLLNGTVLVVVVSGLDAIAALAELVGPPDPCVAAKTAPGSLRALFGTSAVKNAVYYSASREQTRADTAALLGYISMEEAAGDEEVNTVVDEEYSRMTTKELRDLAKRQLRELQRERDSLRAHEKELRKREAIEVRKLLYPQGPATIDSLMLSNERSAEWYSSRNLSQVCVPAVVGEAIPV